LVLKIKGLVLFKIASGVAVGANLEFADRSTLLQAFTEKRLIEGC
jgi:recombinational DNA repair protein RecR